MKTKLFLLVMLFNGYVQFSYGQIGVVPITTPKLAVPDIGNSDTYGKSTLPICTPRSVSCSQAFTYTFTGNGNWSNESNWEGNVIPPAVLPQGASIIIDPVPGGECVLNIIQTVLSGATVKVKAGKKIKLLSHLIIR